MSRNQEESSSRLRVGPIPKQGPVRIGTKSKLIDQTLEYGNSGSTKVFKTPNNSVNLKFQTKCPSRFISGREDQVPSEEPGPRREPVRDLCAR
ncbi:unnamed protein product [Rhodiola kirilowii]